MQQVGQEPEQLLLQAVSQGSLEQALGLFWGLEEQGLPPSQAGIDCLVQGAPDLSPDQILSALPAQDQRPHSLQVECSAINFPLAVFLFHGVCLCDGVGLVCCAALCKANRFAAVWSVYSSAQAQGCSLKYGTYQALMTAAIQVGSELRQP